MSLNLAELLIKHLHSTEHFSRYVGIERVKLREKKPQTFSFYSIHSHLVNAASFILSVFPVYLLGHPSDPAETVDPISGFFIYLSSLELPSSSYLTTADYSIHSFSFISLLLSRAAGFKKSTAFSSEVGLWEY